MSLEQPESNVAGAFMSGGSETRAGGEIEGNRDSSGQASTLTEGKAIALFQQRNKYDLIRGFSRGAFAGHSGCCVEDGL